MQIDFNLTVWLENNIKSLEKLIKTKSFYVIVKLISWVIYITYQLDI